MLRNCCLKIFIVLISCSEIFCEDERQALYKYRYETEDMMQPSASSAPVRGYQVVEGGYYPHEGAEGAESGLIGSAIGPIGVGGGLGLGGGQFIGGGGGISHLGYVGGIGAGGGGGGIGYGGIGGAGLGGAGLGGGIGYGRIISPQFIGGGGGIGGAGLGAGGIGIGGGGIGLGGAGVGYGGAGYGIGGGGLGVGGGIGVPLIHGYGKSGEIIDNSHFSGEKKNLADGKFENAQGKKGGELNQGQSGFSSGLQGVKDIKGEQGYYSNAGGAKNALNDGKHYYGGQNFNQEGKNGVEDQAKKAHKKGHKVNGYKSSHHKDESGKTEEFYDEEHDEGDNFFFKGQNGQFGQQGASTYKGGHLDDKFNEAEHKKSGLINNEFVLKKENADQGKYGQNNYAGGGSVYGVNNGVDQQSLLGHQENERHFKHHQVPFYHHL